MPKRFLETKTNLHCILTPTPTPPSPRRILRILRRRKSKAFRRSWKLDVRTFSFSRVYPWGRRFGSGGRAEGCGGQKGSQELQGPTSSKRVSAVHFHVQMQTRHNLL